MAGICGIEAIGVIDDVGVGTVLDEADIAVGVREGAGTKGCVGAASGDGTGVIGGEIKDVAAATGGEIGDGVSEIAFGFVEPAEGIGTGSTGEDVGAGAANESVVAITSGEGIVAVTACEGVVTGA